MESMFELGFLDVSDMRWRTPTKTFRKSAEKSACIRVARVSVRMVGIVV